MSHESFIHFKRVILITNFVMDLKENDIYFICYLFYGQLMVSIDDGW